MAYFPDTRVALIIGPLWLVLLTALFYGLALHTNRSKNSAPDGASLGHSSHDGAS
jgi:AAT family amino acid transporter